MKESIYSRIKYLDNLTKMYKIYIDHYKKLLCKFKKS